MLHSIRRFTRTHLLPVAFSLLAAAYVSAADSKILGELKLTHSGGIEKLAGVWVDGQYLGYLKELKGSKKVLLMPGPHDVSVRHVGYQTFTTRVVVEPGQAQVLAVTLQPDPRTPIAPGATAEVRTLVQPKRAAVFVDQTFVGHVDEFDSAGQGLVLPAGRHQIKIALPGYRDFETEIELLPGQKFELKTELLKGSISQAGPLITDKRR